ncbi:MAG: NACHT domain-containing protein, partial [Nannocystaceae bacterium]
MAVAPPTRVAVVQLAYHPAAVVHQRSPLCDPLFDPARPTSSLEPRAGVRLSEALQGDLRGLGERVRRAHGAQIAGKVAAILGACRGWGVDLVVFPEYSLACELLPAIAAAAGDMIVVAGTHAVDQAALAGDVYRALACPEDQRPRLGEAVCPVLFRGELLALQPKLHAAPPERGSLRLGDRWRPIDLPEETGVPGPLGALVCLDFLVRESDAHRRLVAPHLEGSTLLAVPSLTPDFTLPEFAAKLREEARRYKRPVAYANLAREGGTTVAADDTIGAPFPFGAGELPAGDEGVIVVDVDLRPGRRGRSRAYAEAPIVTPFAEASLVYRTHPHGDAFAAWIETLHQAIAALPADDDGSALVELLGTVDERRQFLLDAGAIPGASARGRRIAALLDRLGSIHSAEELARYTREVIVPPEILPFEHVREAMALGAHEEVHGWVTAPERDVGVEVMEIAHRLKAGGKPMRMPQEGMWTEAGRRGIEAVRRAVAGERPAESGANAPSMPTHSSADEASPPGGPPPESRDFEIDGLHVHLRRDGREVHEFQRARSRDGIWPEIQILEADELRAWLVDEGVTDVRLVGVTDAQGRRRSGLYVLGRRPDKGDFRLWRVATAEPVMTGKRLRLLLTRLGIEVPGAEGRHLDVLRARLSGLVDRLRDRVLDDLGARRAEKLDDVEQHYEPPDVTIGGSGAPTPALGALDAWIDDDAGSTALLLGEFGAGKSTLLTEWAQRRWKAGAGRLPVLVPLLEARVDEAPTQLLLRALGREDTEVECARLSLLLRHRRLVPCFDGVDEVATRIDESALRARLRVLSDCTGPMGQVLISARDHTFGSDGELARALPGARRFTLAPLSEDKVSHLIGEIRGADADAILRRLAGTYDLADLVRRPLLLGMVLKSLDELDPAARVGTADVYNAYIAHWLRQSHVGAAEALGDDAKIVYAEELAAELWRSGAPSCSIQQLRARVLEVLRDQLIEDGAIDSVSAYYEIQTGAFFVRESDNSFRFAHRSFLEFFLARGLVRHLESEPGRRLATRPLTREVLLFVDQLLRREYGDPLES